MFGALPKILMREQVGGSSVKEEMKSGLTALTSGRVIGLGRSESLGMAYPICEPVLVGSPSIRDIGPLGVGKGFVLSPQAFDTTSTLDNRPSVCGKAAASMISDKDSPAPQEPLVFSLPKESSEIDLDRYEAPPTLLLSSVLGQIPPSEEYVFSRGGGGGGGGGGVGGMLR